MPETKDIIDEILYGKGGPYVSAIPVLMGCYLRDSIDHFMKRLFKI